MAKYRYTAFPRYRRTVRVQSHWTQEQKEAIIAQVKKQNEIRFLIERYKNCEDWCKIVLKAMKEGQRVSPNGKLNYRKEWTKTHWKWGRTRAELIRLGVQGVEQLPYFKERWAWLHYNKV